MYSLCGCLLYYNSNPILLSFGRDSFLCFLTAIFNLFLLAVCVILAETLDFYFIFAKSIMQFLPRVSCASYLCWFVFDQFLTTKRHSSVIQPSCIPIFSLFLEVVYPVGMTEFQFCFMQKISYP